MAFEAEITQSIRELQGAVAKLSNEVAKSNAGLRQTQQAIKGVAAGTNEAAAAARNHARDMREVQKATKELGGPAGRAVKEMMELADLSPRMLLMGGAIGGLAAGMAALGSAIASAKAEMDALDAAGRRAIGGAGAALQGAAGKAALTVDPNLLRQSVSGVGGNISGISDFAIADLAAGMGVDKSTALSRIDQARRAGVTDRESLFGAATEQADVSLRQALIKQTSAGLPGNMLADKVASLQATAKLQEDQRQADLARIAVGGDVSPGRRAELAMQTEDVRKELDAFADALKKNREAMEQGDRYRLSFPSGANGFSLMQSREDYQMEIEAQRYRTSQQILVQQNYGR